MHQRGNSLNIQELYSHYHLKTKSGANAAQAIIASSQGSVANGPSQPTRVGQHQTQAMTPAGQNGLVLQNNLIGGGQFNTIDLQANQQQLFLPGTMKMQVAARKQPVT